MRIVAGKYGGRRLTVPKNNDIRPTTDKVRGAIFNMLQARGCVEGSRVLDAFCGSGALGLEALSRGAASCMFFDKSRTSLDLAKQNAHDFGAENTQFRIQDSTKLKPLSDGGAFDLILLDPPYNKGFCEVALNVLIGGEWLSDGAIIVCETEKNFSFAVPPALCMLLSEKTYGEIKVSVLRYDAGI